MELNKSSYTFAFQNKGYFNLAMQYFIQAVNQIGCHYQTKFEDYKSSVKVKSFVELKEDNYKFNSDHLEDWTNACKTLLLDLKWLIYMTQVEDSFSQKVSD
jgi:hypothetical protein